MPQLRQPDGSPGQRQKRMACRKPFHAITLSVSTGDAELSGDGGPAGHMVAGMDDSTGRGCLQAALRRGRSEILALASEEEERSVPGKLRLR